MPWRSGGYLPEALGAKMPSVGYKLPNEEWPAGLKALQLSSTASHTKSGARPSWCRSIDHKNIFIEAKDDSYVASYGLQTTHNERVSPHKKNLSRGLNLSQLVFHIPNLDAQSYNPGDDKYFDDATLSLIL